MMKRVWRITHKKYRDTAFSGEGARLYGGRFNSEGRKAVYTSGHLSLALLELFVQMDNRHHLNHYVKISADIPFELIYEPELKEFPDGWGQIPYGKISQSYGDEWIKDENFAAIRVPSVVVPVEYNFIINPGHPDYQKIKLSKPSEVKFDPRFEM